VLATQFVPGWAAVALFLPLGGVPPQAIMGLLEELDG